VRGGDFVKSLYKITTQQENDVAPALIGAKHKRRTAGTTPLHFTLPDTCRGNRRLAKMANWLFKEEPDTYSFADLERDGSTTWSGVTNALAQKHLRSIKKGDRVFFYHTGNEKAVVGLMEVTADPTPDPEDETGKRVIVTVTPVRKLKTPVTLAAIKADKAFASWELVRQARLSVMPVPDALWGKIEKMGNG
jgi:predicted RNA-binding protein with PUA-like domain